MQRVAALALLAGLAADCGGGASEAVDLAVPSPAAPAASAAPGADAADPDGTSPALRGCDSVEVTVWLHALGLSGWSVGPVDGQTALYLPEHPLLAQRVAEVREKCGDAVEVTTGPPFELVG